MIARSRTTHAAGTALTAHGTATLVADPLPQRASRMADRGFAPGVPHAVLVPLLEVVSGTLLPRTGLVGAAAAAAATALGAVRVGADIEDRTVTTGTAAAAGLTVAGLSAGVRATRGRSRAGLLAVIATVVVFELVRRRRVLRTR
ncbi:hypothetical protein E9228_000412 [Curtobacterium flaccumfaciens]|uniref:Uncharacterized protein n=1 Tax=Curtobacterium salicis TaxID=1779862 RepID=A0ABX0T6I4_9MICO|nr:hypothetical protein [Curtobacterium sp. WW7]NII39793.1 hypothetical protein [Curtobacterium sp. WW7]